MIKKIKSKLAVKVFIISALLMAFCCGITYFFILHFAPYIYSYTPSDVEWLADELAQELSMTDKGETAIYFSIANDTLTGDYNNEYLFHLFNSEALQTRPQPQENRLMTITQRKQAHTIPILSSVRSAPILCCLPKTQTRKARRWRRCIRLSPH